MLDENVSPAAVIVGLGAIVIGWVIVMLFQPGLTTNSTPVNILIFGIVGLLPSVILYLFFRLFLDGGSSGF